jgi:hypothetical protein
MAVPDPENGMALLRFERDRLVQEPGAFATGDDAPAFGECLPFPPPSAAVFGYAQKRGIVAFNATSHAAVWHQACSRFEEVIRGVHLLDRTAFALLLDIKVIGEPGTHERLLRTLPMGDLPGGPSAQRALGAWPQNYTAPIAVGDRQVLCYSLATRTFEARTAALEPSTHPLTGLVLDNRDTLRLPLELCLHPSLPLALIVDRDPSRNQHHAIHVAHWGGGNPGIAMLPGANSPGMYCSGVEFSPDGRWVVYRDDTQDSMAPVLMAHPVMRDSLPFVGPPVRLGTLAGGPLLGTCWCINPLRFVATDGRAIYSWQF